MMPLLPQVLLAPLRLGLCVLFFVVADSLEASAAETGDHKGNGIADWTETVSYRMPEDAVTKDRVARAAQWLKGRLVLVSRRDSERPLSVIAWKDPTLDRSQANLLAGYLITDTLWSAKALKLFDPAASQEMERSLRRLGWYGNQLHDVLFHPVGNVLHCPADADFVHGFSLGRYSLADGRIVDLRVFRQKWDSRADEAYPRLFAEHALYRVLDDYWHGRREQARHRVLEIINGQRTAKTHDRIFWDDQADILVDDVTRADWLAFRQDQRPACRHYTFKSGLLLYAVRLLGLEKNLGSRLGNVRRRLWSAQIESGGVAHYVDVRSDGTATAGLDPTGEASAIAILAEVVDAKRPP